MQRLKEIAVWLKGTFLRYKPWLTNRYVLVGGAAIVWALFFDQYDLGQQYRLRSRVAKLEADKAYYQREIARLTLQRNLMRNNHQEVERVAREQYLMKRANEDLYLLVPEEK